MSKNSILFCGIDLHKKFSFMTLMDAKGEILKEGKVLNEHEEIMLFFKGCSATIKVALEATFNWYWFVDLLGQMGFEVHMSHPYKTKIIGESHTKTDKIDARSLAHLLRMNYLPEAYIADKAIRDQREYLRNRIFLVQLKTAIKNRIHTLLDKHHIQHVYSDLFGKQGLGFLKCLKLPQSYSQRCLDDLLQTFEELKNRVKSMDQKIRMNVKQSHQAQILKTIPGVGDLIALILIYEVGDFTRFSSVKKIISYSGIFASTHASGGKVRQGNITKHGNKYLRWALIQAASSVIRSGKDKRLMKRYRRIRFKKNHLVAKTALAKEILSIAYFLIKKNQAYDPMIMFNNFSSHPVVGTSPSYARES